MSEWISVKDRLPDENGNVIALADENTECRVFEAEHYKCPEYGNTVWSCPYTGDELVCRIIGWMPLPKPPKKAAD